MTSQETPSTSPEKEKDTTLSGYSKMFPTLCNLHPAWLIVIGLLLLQIATVCFYETRMDRTRNFMYGVGNEYNNPRNGSDFRPGEKSFRQNMGPREMKETMQMRNKKMNTPENATPSTIVNSTGGMKPGIKTPVETTKSGASLSGTNK